VTAEVAPEIRVHLRPSVVPTSRSIFERRKMLLLQKETHQIIGCAMEVLNGLGHGLIEKPYEKSLVVEFGLRQIPVLQQPRYDVIYKGAVVGKFIPDLEPLTKPVWPRCDDSGRDARKSDEATDVVEER